METALHRNEPGLGCWSLFRRDGLLLLFPVPHRLPGQLGPRGILAAKLQQL